MRPRITAAVGIAVVSVLLAAPACARSAPTQQVNVTFTDRGCRLQFHSVSPRTLTIVFHLVNKTRSLVTIVINATSKLNATRAGPDLTIAFPGPGGYPYHCTSGTDGHVITLTKGVFTIRKHL
jgi:hypothetical protein